MSQQNKNQPKAKTGLARCLELASGHKGLVFLSGVLAALAAVCSFVPYLSIYYIIREILFVYPDMSLLNVSTISTWGWLALAGILGNIVFYFFALLCSHIAAFGTLYELKVAFADHIMHIPLGYHLTLGSGKLRKIMDENIESVEKFIAHQLPDFVASLVAPLVLVIILLGIDWRYGVVCLVGIVLAFIVQFAGFNGEAKEKMHRFQTAQENMNSASVEYVRGMPEIKAFNQTADSFKRLSKSITDYTSFVLEYALGWQNCMPAFTTIINNIYLFLIPVGVLIGMHTTDFREYSLTFIFYLIIVHAISGILNKIMYISESFTQIDGSVERMDEILRIPVLPEKNTSADIQHYDIAFQDVSFSYEADSQVMALAHISFLAPQGKVTAVVGPSGGGKSTIANLISRFYDVTDGSIQIGGVDIRDIPLDALMDKVSFVFQDTFLFKQSILDNIRMGNPDATEEQVIAAAKAARCHDFIEQLPNGYQTVIGSTGVHLSGGERQRIAIARAIVKDAPIIVLDEATAFSDPENEYLIQKAFEKLIQNKTVVMIAHRLSTIRNADQILVMEKGHLIESGTHDELLKKGGKYAQMWSSYTESINWKISTGKAVGSMSKLKEKLMLSEKGYSDLKKAITACTITNIALLLPSMVACLLFWELLKPFTGETISWVALWKLLGLGVVAAILVFLAAKNDYRKTYIASYKEASTTRLRIAEHLRKLPMSFFNTKDLSDITTNMMADCSSMESMLSSTIPPLIANIISVTLTCICLAFFDWRMALAIFCTMPITFLIIWCGRKLQLRLFDKQVDVKLEASSQIQEYLEGIKIIKACGLGGSRFSTLDKALQAMRKIAIKVELASGILVQGASLILQAGLGIAIFIGTVLITGGEIELLPLLVLLMFSTQIYGPILAILSQLTSLFHLGTVTNRMRTLLTTPAMEGEDKDVSKYDIELKSVTFGYNRDDVIKDVSFSIPAGSITALVGPSGSGKSTISKLIARFWDVRKGQITIGGMDVRTIEPEHLMRCMSFVFQDVTLFNDTVFNNIRVGNMNATEEQVMAAAKAAYCDEFIQRLPDGYQTVLGENGSTLSGGERQRISIARALLKDAPIILLDEATASLDPENEVLIQRAIAKLVEGKTVIMIAHRLRTVVDADQIIVLEDGKLAELGTHKELMEKKGLYEKLYHIQQESLGWAV